MRVEGGDKLVRQLRALPEASQVEIRRAVKRSVQEGERVANTLAPDRTHETRGNIYSEVSESGYLGRVVGIDPAAPREDKDRAYSVEFGRKRSVGRDGKKRGTTAGYRFMSRTRTYLAKRWKGRVRRAIRKAAKEAARNG